MPCARIVSSIARRRAAAIGVNRSAPIVRASGTDERYSRYPRSSFTSITSAFTSVRLATSISCHTRLPIAAHRLT
jgi:hypothetical protein